MDGELKVIRFRRKADGIGLSLAGNKDRSKLSVFVVASKSGLNTEELCIGDEILEVNKRTET